MLLVVKMSDKERLDSCCGRYPIVGACLDLSDEYVPVFDIYCPVCEICVTGPSFIELRRDWNSKVDEELDNERNY